MKILKKILVVLVAGLFSLNVFGQSDLSGEWIVGKKNTHIKFYKSESGYVGKIVSSDNPKAEIGKLMVKDLKQIKGTWKGKVFSPKRNKWFSAEFTPETDKLKIKISAGFFSKKTEWIKAPPKTKL